MKVKEVEEHEDGSATFHFDIDEDEKDIVVEAGLRTILISAAIGMSVDEMFKKLMEDRE